MEKGILEDHGQRVGRFLTATRSLIRATRNGASVPEESFEVKALQQLLVAMIERAMAQSWPRSETETREGLLRALGTEDAPSVEEAVGMAVEGADADTLNRSLLAHLGDPWAQVYPAMDFSIDRFVDQAIKDGYRIEGVFPEVMLLISRHFKNAQPLFGW